MGKYYKKTYRRKYTRYAYPDKSKSRSAEEHAADVVISTIQKGWYETAYRYAVSYGIPSLIGLASVYLSGYTGGFAYGWSP